jgi:hypothetical protein
MPMSREERVGHVPKILKDRNSAPVLLKPRQLGTHIRCSRTTRLAALQQGYSAAMLVEESPMLQVSIFETLKKNMAVLYFSILQDRAL